MNNELLNLLKHISLYWNNEFDRTESLNGFREYVKNSPDFNTEIKEIIEHANHPDGQDEVLTDLITALQYNYLENKTYLVFILKYLAERAITTHDYYAYFLSNEVKYEEFIKAVPEVAKQIMPSLAPLLKSGFSVNQLFAIHTAKYCLIADPLSDKSNVVVALQETLHDKDWIVRYHTYKCLKRTKNLPVGYRRSFLDLILPIIFNKKVKY